VVASLRRPTDHGAVTHEARVSDFLRVTAAELRGDLDALLAGSPRRVEVDLGELRMIDSTVVGRVVSLYKKARARGGDAVVTGLHDQPRALFKLLRLDHLIAP
jgi:anti-sigma B factor antagonist